VTEEILSSSEGSPVKGLDPAEEPLESPVLESEQALRTIPRKHLLLNLF